MTSRDVEYIPTYADVYSSDSGQSEELSGATASQEMRGTASQESRCAQLSPGYCTGTFPYSGLSQVIGDVSISSRPSTPTKLPKRRSRMAFGRGRKRRGNLRDFCTPHKGKKIRIISPVHSPVVPSIDSPCSSQAIGSPSTSTSASVKLGTVFPRNGIPWTTEIFFSIQNHFRTAFIFWLKYTYMDVYFLVEFKKFFFFQ